MSLPTDDQADRDATADETRDEDRAADIKDPRGTEHPAGDEHARANIDNEPAG